MDYAALFSMIKDAGVNTGTSLQKSDDQTTSDFGAGLKTAADPYASLTERLKNGDEWWKVIGGASPIASGIMNRMEKKEEVDKEDARQRAFLDEINRKRKALESGRDYAYELANKQVQKGLAQTQQNVLRSGSDIASVQQGLNIAQQNAGDQYNKATAGLLSQQGIFTQLANQQIDKLAERKLNIEEQQYMQKLLEKSNQQQATGQNMEALFAQLLGDKGSDNTDTMLKGFGKTYNSPTMSNPFQSSGFGQQYQEPKGINNWDLNSYTNPNYQSNSDWLKSNNIIAY